MVQMRGDIMPKISLAPKSAALRWRSMNIPTGDSPGSALGAYPAITLRQNNLVSMSAPTHTQPGGFIDVAMLLSGAGRSTATISGHICQLGPIFGQLQVQMSASFVYNFR